MEPNSLPLPRPKKYGAPPAHAGYTWIGTWGMSGSLEQTSFTPGCDPGGGFAKSQLHTVPFGVEAGPMSTGGSKMTASGPTARAGEAATSTAASTLIIRVRS